MGIEINDLCKSFGENVVLDHVSMSMSDGGRYCLMAPSGTGKTTLVRCLAGLETPDSGSISGLTAKRIGIVFQEDRLLEEFSAYDNVRIASGAKPADVRRHLGQLLPAEFHDAACKNLSGGMRRRTAICRAILFPCHMVIMDEPFAGLDDATKKRTCDYISSNLNGRTLLLVSHQEEDAFLLGAEIIRL